MSYSYESKVAQGVQLLDQNVPNWRDKINVDNLDLGSCSICVLGQVFGDYNDGLNALGVDGYDYGFNTTGSYASLKEAWVEALGKNNKLVEKGDIYRDSYSYAVKVLQTSLVKVSDTETISIYIVQTGRVKNGAFQGDVSMSKPQTAILQRRDFETAGAYSIKVPVFTPKPGTFITAGGRNYFVCSDVDIRELKDGAYAVNISSVDLSGAKEMMTGTGVTFAKSVKNSI